MEVAVDNFTNMKEVYPQPPFIAPIIYPDAYAGAVGDVHACEYNLNRIRTALKNPPVNQGTEVLTSTT